jgi:two-component system, cell cycle response regulator
VRATAPAELPSRVQCRAPSTDGRTASTLGSATLTTDPKRALEVLLQLTAQLADDRPLEEFLKAVTDGALALIASDHASIRLLDTSRMALLSGARSGSGEEDRPMSFRRGEGVLGWVVEHGEATRIDDVEHDSRWIKPAGQTFRIRSIMAEPLWSNGEVIGVLAVTSPERAVFTADDQLVLRLLANCSSPPIERARLRRLAMFDDTTMAFNHRYLVPRLTEEMERAGRSAGDVSLLYMDLDHFKAVNDGHGHAAGDAVLRMFADRVRKAVRRIDVLIRRGGEEFVLIMPQTGATQAHATGNRIQQALKAEPFELESGGRLTQTASIGVATWDKRESPDQLERRADGAMYEAKRLGKDRVVVAAPRDVG